MSYYKWVANADKGDFVSHLVLEDGMEVVLGVPVQMSAELKKSLEAEGRVFESSSKSEAEEVKAAQTETQVGIDTAQAGPTFVDSGEANQTTGADAPGETKK
jgi:hypothetical protein